MKINLLKTTNSITKTSFKSKNEPNMAIILLELPNDTFERQNCFTNEYDDEILAGPYGHPYSGRPIINGSTEPEKELSFIQWLFSPQRSELPRPKTFIGKLFSLGELDFDDDVAKYHAQQAMEIAKDLVGKSGPINIPLGDLNKDGIIDSIVSGINKAIDITGDGKADIIGTLVDLTGDGKADAIIDSLGNIVELNGKIAQVVDNSGLELEDLKAIPQIIMSLLGK